MDSVGNNYADSIVNGYDKGCLTAVFAGKKVLYIEQERSCLCRLHNGEEKQQCYSDFLHRLKLKTEIHTHSGNIAGSRVVGVVDSRVYIDTQVIRDVVVAQVCIDMGIHNLK